MVDRTVHTSVKVLCFQNFIVFLSFTQGGGGYTTGLRLRLENSALCFFKFSGQISRELGYAVNGFTSSKD